MANIFIRVGAIVKNSLNSELKPQNLRNRSRHRHLAKCFWTAYIARNAKKYIHKEWVEQIYFTTTTQRHNEQRRLQIIDYRFADWMDRGQVACRWHCAPRNNAYKITSNEQQSRNKLIGIPFFVTVHGLSASQTHNEPNHN